MAVSEDVKKRFAEYVKVQALGGRFIDRETEKKILEDGVMRFELGLDDGRQIMLGVASDQGYAFETEAERRIAEILEDYADNGRIDRRQFGDAVGFYRRFCAFGVSEEDAKKRIKKIMVANGWKAKRNGMLGTRRWFNKVEVE